VLPKVLKRAGGKFGEPLKIGHRSSGWFSPVSGSTETAVGKDGRRWIHRRWSRSIRWPVLGAATNFLDNAGELFYFSTFAWGNFCRYSSFSAPVTHAEKRIDRDAIVMQQ
jgi:hypothetical protein